MCQRTSVRDRVKTISTLPFSLLCCELPSSFFAVPSCLPFCSANLPLGHLRMQTKERKKKRLSSNGYIMAWEYCTRKSSYRPTNGGSFIIIVNGPNGVDIFELFPRTVIVDVVCVNAAPLHRGTTSKEPIPVRGELVVTFLCHLLSLIAKASFRGPAHMLYFLRGTAKLKEAKGGG